MYEDLTCSGCGTLEADSLEERGTGTNPPCADCAYFARKGSQDTAAFLAARNARRAELRGDRRDTWV